jgi:excisionase family DNA binding protein
MDGAVASPRRMRDAKRMVLDGRGYYNVTQAAARLGVSRVSIWRWIRDGRLPAQRLGHRTTRIKADDLDRLLVQIEPNGAHAWGSREPAVRERRLDSEAAADWAAVRETDHLVQFYETDDFLCKTVAAFVGPALRGGDAGVVIATEAHRAGIERRLRADGIEVDAASRDGRYLALDAATLLSQFMTPDGPDRHRFTDVIGKIIAEAGQGQRRVRVFGEMVTLLVDDGRHGDAVHLEQHWNELQAQGTAHSRFALLCAYPMVRLGGEALEESLGDLCLAHSRVFPAESFTTLPRTDDRLRAIAALQQKAQSLADEVVARQQAAERLQTALTAERSARRDAETAQRLRDEFLAIAAHELRNPLAGLSLHAQLALRRFTRDGHDGPQWVEQSLQAITDHASKLARLVDQLLDVSRLEAGTLSIEQRPADLAALVTRVAATIQARSNHRAIRVTAPASLRAWVDPPRLEQVLTNLLDNAIKYSPDDGAIDVVLSQPGPATIELSVRDRGLGIPPETRGAIFERFSQARAEDARQGLGLGLYVSRQIVALHGGETHAEFPPDGGTRIVVRLPDGLECTDGDQIG